MRSERLRPAFKLARGASRHGRPGRVNRRRSLRRVDARMPSRMQGRDPSVTSIPTSGAADAAGATHA